MNNITILKLFKKALKENETNTKLENTFDLLKYGIYVDGPVSYTLKRMISYVYAVDLKAANSTFYKSYDTVEGLTETERHLLQLIHYASTYGDIEEFRNDGNIFVPEQIDFDKIPNIQDKFTYIHLTDKEELFEDILALLTKGIALDDEDVDGLVDFIIKNYNQDQAEKLARSSANKQVKLQLYLELNIPLEDIDLFMGQLHEIVRPNTTFIKGQYIEVFWFDKNKLNRINTMLKRYISDYKEETLIQNFRRYKKFLLSIRKAAAFYEITTLTHKINRIARKNKKNNKRKENRVPINQKLNAKQRTNLVKSMNIFQLVKMYNVLSERLSIDDDFIQSYKIRTGKVFITEKETYKLEDKARYKVLLADIRAEMKTRYEGKLNKFKFNVPDNMKLAMPTSLKNTLDNVPDFSTVKIDEEDDLQIGCYWEVNADIDLHADTESGHHIGYYSTLIDQGLTHTGDMTSINDQGFAAEYIKISDEVKDKVAFVTTLYSGYRIKEDFVNMKFIIANDKKEGIIVAEDDIIFTKNIKVDSKNTTTFLGVYDPEERLFIFSSNKQETGCIPNEELNNKTLVPTTRKAKTSLKLDEFLDIINYEPDEDIEKEIDLDNFDVVELISLLED